MAARGERDSAAGAGTVEAESRPEKEEEAAPEEDRAIAMQATSSPLKRAALPVQAGD
jgi:hypothetical protein